VQLITSIIGLVLVGVLLAQEVVHRRQLQNKFMEGFECGTLYAEEMRKKEND
jgi:hypothetical protein